MAAVSGAETLQDCHRVTNTAQTTTQSNKSQVRLWHAETALPEVTDEINGLAEAWAREKGMDRVWANIYSFNEQSKKMFLALGFTRVSEEEYELKL